MKHMLLVSRTLHCAHTQGAGEAPCSLHPKYSMAVSHHPVGVMRGKTGWGSEPQVYNSMSPTGKYVCCTHSQPSAHHCRACGSGALQPTYVDLAQYMSSLYFVVEECDLHLAKRYALLTSTN